MLPGSDVKLGLEEISWPAKKSSKRERKKMDYSYLLTFNFERYFSSQSLLKVRGKIS